MDALRFDRFELRPAQRQLLDRGRPVEIGARALDVLCMLVAHAGSLVTKDALLDRVWAGVIVEEANLHVQVSGLRKLLGREAIATVPGRGYQFVRHLEGGLPAALPAQATQAALGDMADPATSAGTAHLPALIGREAELRRLQALLAQGPLVTVTGAGGSGKTLLVRHLVLRLQADVPARADATPVWVELQDVAEGAAVPAAVASAIGFGPGAGSLSALGLALAGSRRLLVLDNAEHLLPDVAGLVRALRASAPGVRFLLTSQAPLKLDGEQRLRLGGLAVPAWPCTAGQALAHAAVAVFTARARQVDRRFRLDDTTVEDVVALCAALDGHALGIQLAASLLAMQPVAEVRRRLAPDRTPQDVITAQPAENVLRAALAWSHGLLDEGPRRVFRRLAVAVGALPLPLLLRVASDADMDLIATADALGDLVDRSLVELEPIADGGAPRYRLLEAPRNVALEALQASGEATAVRARLVAGLALQSEAVIDALLHDEDARTRQAAFGGWPAVTDVLASLDWAMTHDLKAAAAIARTVASHQMAARDRMACAARLVEGAAGLSPRDRATALMSAAALTKHSDLGKRHALFMEAARFYAESGETRLRYHALARAAEAGAVHRDPALADDPLVQARALEDPSWPAGLRQLLAVAEAATLSARDELAAAVPAWRRALDLSRSAGATSFTTLVSLADAELMVGEVDAACRHLREAADIALAIGQQNDRWTFILANLTAACLMRGDLAGARLAAAEAWPHVRRLDADAWWSDHLALLAAREGRVHTAALLLGMADAAYVRIKDGRHQLESLHANAAADLVSQALGADRCEALRRAGATGAWEERLQRQALSTEDVDAP